MPVKGLVGTKRGNDVKNIFLFSYMLNKNKYHFSPKIKPCIH